MSATFLPAGYHFTIELAYESGGNVASATFRGSDNNGNVFTPQTMALAGQPDGLSESQLAPIVAFQLLLVGTGQGKKTQLTSGAGTWTVSARDNFIASDTLPAGGCFSFSGPGTPENSNCTYGELLAAPARAFTQAFSV